MEATKNNCKGTPAKRRLKISPKQVIYQSIWNTSAKPHDHVPEIRLVGEWLRNTGFESGQYVFVTAENGKLIIEVDKTE